MTNLIGGRYFLPPSPFDHIYSSLSFSLYSLVVSNVDQTRICMCADPNTHQRPCERTREWSQSLHTLLHRLRLVVLNRHFCTTAVWYPKETFFDWWCAYEYADTNIYIDLQTSFYGYIHIQKYMYAYIYQQLYTHTHTHVYVYIRFHLSRCCWSTIENIRFVHLFRFHEYTIVYTISHFKIHILKMLTHVYVIYWLYMVRLCQPATRIQTIFHVQTCCIFIQRFFCMQLAGDTLNIHNVLIVYVGD